MALRCRPLDRDAREVHRLSRAVQRVLRPSCQRTDHRVEPVGHALDRGQCLPGLHHRIGDRRMGKLPAQFFQIRRHRGNLRHVGIRLSDKVDR